LETVSANLDSTVQNQQTFGLSEAFTFVIQDFYGKGDYLYKLSELMIFGLAVGGS
jgi:hypothetical protein